MIWYSLSGFRVARWEFILSILSSGGHIRLFALAPCKTIALNLLCFIFSISYPIFSVKLLWAVLGSSHLTTFLIFFFSNGQKRKKKKQRSREDESSSSSSSSSDDSDSNSDSDSDKNNDKKKLGKRDTKQVKYGLKSKQIVKKLWCLLGCTSDKVNYQ